VHIGPPPPLTSHQYQGGSDSGIGRDTCHLLVKSDPPPNTTYHLRGVRPIPLSLQNRPPQIFQNRPFFPVQQSSSEADSGKMKMNFKKPREVFVHNGMKNKNLSHFFTGATSWENRSHLSASFFSFRFSCFSPDFAGAVSARWRRIWRNQRRFLSRTCSYTITSFIFYTGVTVEEKQMSELTPFFRNSAHLSWRTVQIFRDFFYFWPRWLNSTS
jgi:hypothetical protein